jgi:hypothetical protein
MQKLRKGSLGKVYAHAGVLETARVIWDDMEQHGILPVLLSNDPVLDAPAHGDAAQGGQRQEQGRGKYAAEIARRGLARSVGCSPLQVEAHEGLFKACMKSSCCDDVKLGSLGLCLARSHCAASCSEGYSSWQGRRTHLMHKPASTLCTVLSRCRKAKQSWSDLLLLQAVALL